MRPTGSVKLHKIVRPQGTSYKKIPLLLLISITYNPSLLIQTG